MKRILIYKKVIENGEYDILKEIDYSEIANTVKTKYAGMRVFGMSPRSRLENCFRNIKRF